jgi:hypothetical protein
VGKNSGPSVSLFGRIDMNARRIATAFLFAALVLGPVLAAGGGGAVHKVSLEEVLSIGGLDDQALFQWTGVATDAASNIYVLDAMDYSLKKFGPDGRLLKKTGRKGQGPGEFMAPRLLASSGERLFATDQNVFGIYVFDRELRFLKTIPCPSLILALAALGDGRLAAAVMGMSAPGKVMIFGPDGQVQSEFVPAVPPGKGVLMDSMSFAQDGDGQFYVAYLFRDSVEKWTREGNRLWFKALLGGKTVATTEVRSLVVPTETCYKDVALDSFGHVFVLGGKLSKHPSRDVYVLDKFGALLATFTLPEPSHCLHLDSRNYLYARANDGITLKKYRILYD